MQDDTSATASPSSFLLSPSPDHLLRQQGKRASPGESLRNQPSPASESRIIEAEVRTLQKVHGMRVLSLSEAMQICTRMPLTPEKQSGQHQVQNQVMLKFQQA